MKGKRLWIAVGALAVVALIIGINLARKHNPTAQALKVGAILPQTGSAASTGEWCRNGMEVAAAEINGGGGVSGRPLQIVYEDSQNDQKTGITAFRKVVSVEDVPVAVVAMSGVANGILPIAQEEEVTIFATVVSLPGFPQRSEWAFRYHISGDQEAQKMAAFANKLMGGGKKVAVLYINDEFGRSTAQEFERALRAGGGEVAVSEPYEKDLQDYRSTLTKVLAAKPEAAYMVGYDKSYALVFKQLKEMRFGGPVFTISGLEIPAWRALIGEAAEGAYYTAPLYNIKELTATQKGFRAAYQQRYNSAPPYVAAECYDVVQLIASAASQKGEFTSQAIRDGLNQIRNLDLSMGRVTMQNRDVLFPLAILQIKNGQPTLIEE